MREIHYVNQGAGTGEFAAVLTVDAVGQSIILPAGARAWMQWSGFCPRNPDATARIWWLVERQAGGGSTPLPPRDIAHGQHDAIELTPGTVAVEIALEQVPPGFAFAAHLDGIGHA